MNKGDVLNGYRITTSPTNAGGGMSQWAFAEKDDRPYFVKMFLSPKFPLPDAPGSETMKARKRAVCLAFEQRHLEIAHLLEPDAPGGGNLVVARDFFRVGATYVKVMDRVQAAELPSAHLLTGHELLVLLRTLVLSLRVLHVKGIVHGDIKPDNVLAQRGGTGLYVSKLIDFDEAYLVGEPPPPELIVGDLSFYSPELLRYVKRLPDAGPTDLGTAADMFSLGLLLCVYLSGELPHFESGDALYPCEAVLAGLAPDVAAAPAAIHALLTPLLSSRPDDRPTIEEVIAYFADLEPDTLVPAPPARRVTAVSATAGAGESVGPVGTAGGYAARGAVLGTRLRNTVRGPAHLGARVRSHPSEESS